ncbi:hypothetical protein PIB30_012787, partial [Stylosanthes scabra]|nr:hypothetical protein [Stylosanthes scabra]
MVASAGSARVFASFYSSPETFASTRVLSNCCSSPLPVFRARSLVLFVFRRWYFTPPRALSRRRCWVVMSHCHVCSNRNSIFSSLDLLSLALDASRLPL